MEGKVYLIGCGISKTHLTAEGLRALQKSNVVFYDRLADENTLKNFRGRKIYAGKKPGESGRQSGINKLLYAHAKAGKTVARLKGGDSFLFARGFEEYDYLRRKGVEVVVVPGISAFQLLSELGIPLTHRGESSSVAFITGQKASGSKLPGLCADTLVFYMPVGNLGKIVSQVRKHKKNACCHLVENAGKENVRVISGSLNDIVELSEEAEITPPALFVVSPHRRRLYAKKILTFRQKEREEETRKKLAGFNVVNHPLFTIKHRKIRKPAAKVFAFTSPNSVESVMSQHKLAGRFVAIGGITAKTLRNYGAVAEVPKTQSSAGLMRHLKKYGKKDVVVFCSPRTKVTGYKKTFAYDVTYARKARGLIKLVKETEVLFPTSTETLNTLCDIAPVKLLNTKTVVVIGAQTAAAAKKRGLRVDFLLEKPLIEGLNGLR